MSPSLRPFLLCTSTSIRPMRPPFCSSRRSASSPMTPAVWPKTAPTTPGLSARPSPIVPLEGLIRVPALGVALPVSGGDVFAHPLDEGVERFDVRDVFPAQSREPGPEFLVEPHAVRREAVPELPGEAAAADVPVREDNRLAVTRGDRLAEPEDRRAFVDQADVSLDAEGSQRPSIVFAFDDDRRETVLLREVFEDLREVAMQLFPIHDRSPKRRGIPPRESRGAIAVSPEPGKGDKGCVATPSYIGRRIRAVCRARRTSILNASPRSTGKRAGRRPS